jgi:WD40 repeat protein
MKYAGLLLSVLLILSIACSAPALVAKTQPPAIAATTATPAGPTVPVSPTAASTDTSVAPAASSTPQPSSTPFSPPSETPAPSPTPAPSGIGPDTLSSLAQLSTILPLNLSNLGNLMSGAGMSNTVPSQLFSGFTPPDYYTLAYSPDGRLLALGGCSQSIGGVGFRCPDPGKPILRLIDTRSGQVLHELTGHTAGVSGVAFSQDGKTLVSASDATDGSIRFWDTGSGSLLRSIKMGTSSGAPVLAISPDGSRLAGAWNQHLRVWDFNTGNVLMDGVSANGGPQFSQDGSLLAAFGSADRSTIAIYDTSTWKQVSTFKIPAQTLAFAFSPDGKTLVTGGENQNSLLHFWDVSGGKELGQASDDLMPQAIAFTPNGRLLLVTGLFNGAKYSIPLKIMSLYDPFTRQRIGELFAPSVSPYLMAISPDGLQFATVQLGGTISIWGLASSDLASARQILLTYLDDLNQGKYTDAATLFYSDKIDATSPDFQSMKQYHPGLNLNDVPGVLMALCQNKRFPCAKFRDTVYQGSIANGLAGALNGGFASSDFSFFVEFDAPDGSALVSPVPCSNAAGSCAPTTAFMFNLERGSDGRFKLVSLPPQAQFP